MIDWPLALSTASQAIKLAQELRSIDNQLSEAELKLKIADLTSALADLKNTLTEARAESNDKDAEIARLKSTNKRIADDLVEHRGYLYRKQPNDARPAGNPFC